MNSDFNERDPLSKVMYGVIKAADVKLEFQIAAHYGIHPCMYRWKHTCSSPNKSVKSHLLISVFTPMVVNRSLIFFFLRDRSMTF